MLRTPATVLGLVAALAFGGPATAEARDPVNHDVLWQFLRPNGHKLYGETLSRQLKDVRIIEGDTVTFFWGEGQQHDLMFTSDADVFDACESALATRTGTNVPTSRSPGDGVVLTPTLGVSYYFDSVGNNCKLGELKISVHVFTEEDFVEDAPTPPATVTQASSTSAGADDGAETAPAVTVPWNIGIGVDGKIETITQDDVIRFNWAPPISLSLTQVTKEGYESCDAADSNLIATWSSRTTEGLVDVGGLPVGLNYFISVGPALCSEDSTKIVVNVLPGAMRLWVTLWASDTSQPTDRPVYITLSGYRHNDPIGKAWSSPERQLNQKATDYDLTAYETVPIDEQRSLHELYVRDVGAVSSVRIRRSAGQTGVSAARVRIQKMDKPTSQSQTFECATNAERADGEEEDVQYCVLEDAASSDAEESAVAAEGSPAAGSCTCFREFMVVGGRVLVCTSDGCLSTSADGENGWSDMHEISHLLGIGTDGNLYGVPAAASTSDANAALLSKDAGLNWEPSFHNVEMSEPVQQYYMDVNNLTTEPLDEHVVHSNAEQVEWGVTSQGVHYSRDGTWELHALWACKCDGACGLKCNQPNPNLI